MSINQRVDTERLSERANHYQLEATEAERAALAKLYGLVSLDALSAAVDAVKMAGGAVRIDGRISARLAQSCVVTLAPVAQSVQADFRYDFLPPEGLAGDGDGKAGGRHGEVVVDLDSDYEPLPASVLNLGDLIGEQLAVNLDPYPRAPGANLAAALPTGVGVQPENPEKTGKNNPFAALARLKPKG